MEARNPKDAERLARYRKVLEAKRKVWERYEQMVAEDPEAFFAPPPPGAYSIPQFLNEYEPPEGEAP